MRGTPLLSIVLLGTALGAEALTAQTPGRLGPDATLTAGASWHHRVLTAVGGAALGAGLGYFASQMSRSDWSEHPGTHTVNRGAWASVGGGLGFAVGLSFPLRGPARSRGSTRVGPGARSVISAGDLQDVVAVNAYEVVRLLRPEWLTVRPADILGDSPSQTLPVYLDDFLLGGIASLRNLPIQDIELIRFVSTAVATARWGIGHNNGAIQVITTG